MDASSAATIEYQMPSSFKIRGTVNTDATWNTRVLIKEITADTSPLFNAVKKDEA